MRVGAILPRVKNFCKVVASGGEYGIVLLNKFNKLQTPFFALLNKKITSIVAFIIYREGQTGALVVQVVVR